MPGNRASSKPCRGEAIGSCCREYCPLPPGQRRRGHAPGRRRRSSVAPRPLAASRAWDGVQRQARGGLGGRRTGYRQDDADRALRRRPGRVVCARGQCVEHYGSGEPYLPVLEALAELCRGDSASRPCCAPWRRPGCCSCRGSAARRTRRPATSWPAWARIDAARDGELLDRYSEGGRCCW